MTHTLITKESQGWLAVAERWQEIPANEAPLGSCPLINEIDADWQIKAQMQERLSRYLDRDGHQLFPRSHVRVAYRTPRALWKGDAASRYVERHREARTLYALWLMCEALEEGR